VNSGRGSIGERQHREEAEKVGAEGEGQPLFLPTPSFVASAGEE